MAVIEHAPRHEVATSLLSLCEWCTIISIPRGVARGKHAASMRLLDGFASGEISLDGFESGEISLDGFESGEISLDDWRL